MIELLWGGTPEELNAWIEYKRERAKRFIDLGYSVEWTPDSNGYMDVWVPQGYNGIPSIRANVRIFPKPSQEFGMDGGRISALDVKEIYEDVVAKAQGQPYINETLLFAYDRGPVFNILETEPRAMELFTAVVRELN